MQASRALNEWKFIVPALVPPGAEVRPGVNSGWTGPGPADPNWWRHAATCCPDSLDPDSGARIPWELLAACQPVDLGADGALAAGSDAEMELARRIASRFHRSGQRHQHDRLPGQGPAAAADGSA